MKYWVDFSGYLKIEADSPEDAERKMWEWINSHNLTGDFSDDVWDIDGIDEAVDFVSPIDVEAFAKDFEDA